MFEFYSNSSQVEHMKRNGKSVVEVGTVDEVYELLQYLGIDLLDYSEQETEYIEDDEFLT